MLATSINITSTGTVRTMVGECMTCFGRAQRRAYTVLRSREASQIHQRINWVKKAVEVFLPKETDQARNTMVYVQNDNFYTGRIKEKQEVTGNKAAECRNIQDLVYEVRDPMTMHFIQRGDRDLKIQVDNPARVVKEQI